MSGETEAELQRAVGRLEGQMTGLDGKLDSFMEEVRQSNRNHISVSAALSKRLGRVETWQTRMTAAGVVVGAIGGFIVKQFFPHK